MNALRTHASVALTSWLVSMSMLCLNGHAGFRPVNRNQPRQTTVEVEKARAFHRTSKVIEPSGGWTTVQILRESEGFEAAMHKGVSDQILLLPDEEVTVVVEKDRLPAGIPIFLFTLHGGQINGKLTETVRTQDGGIISFQFKIGPWKGNYPVILRHAGREEEISFWVEQGGER